MDVGWLGIGAWGKGWLAGPLLLSRPVLCSTTNEHLWITVSDAIYGHVLRIEASAAALYFPLGSCLAQGLIDRYCGRSIYLC